jgi:hypothetical protein
MDQYEIMEQIGRGAFGAVILVNHKIEKKKYDIAPIHQLDFSLQLGDCMLVLIAGML